MAEFNPDAFLAETAPQGENKEFNPDQFLAETGPKKITLDSLKNPSPQDKAMALGYAGRALDYPGGLVRTGLASVGGLLEGKTDVVKSEDVNAAFKGQAPKSSEYMQRLGVPEGPSVTLPFAGKVSARDVGGLVSDVATDPMTAASKSAGILAPANEMAEGLGKGTYKSAFKKVDERLAEKGKQKLSDLLLENGSPTGSTKQVAEKIGEMAQDIAQQRKALYDKATENGVTVDLGFPLERAETKIAKMRQDPGLKDLADKLDEKLQLYKNAGKVPIDKLSDWKTNIYNMLPDSAYGANGIVKGPAKDFQKALASDFRQAIIDAANKSEKGLGDNIDKLNDKWSTLIGSEKPMAMQVRRGETPNFLTSVDAMLSTHPGILATKKAADLSKTTAFRTRLGKGLLTAGQSGAAQGLLNRGLINSDNGFINNGGQ